MLGSLFSGITGLNANATAMSVIGDNIANVNTNGFKSTRPSFANLLSQSLTGMANSEIGRGVMMSSMSLDWEQGTLETTSNATDLSINGKGFFTVRDTNGLIFYTRAGEFRFDKDGSLTNPDGLIAQGWDLSTSSGIGGNPEDITIPGAGMNVPRPTSELSIDVNLDAEAALGDQYTVLLTTYDSLGGAIDLTLTFTKTGNQREWEWSASVPPSVGSVTSPAVPLPTLTFNPDGTLPNGVDPTITIALTNGAAATQTITWDLYDDTGATNGDVTQFASPSTITFMTQNGYPAGTLYDISVDEHGILTGSYSNGQITPLFQLALADFPSYSGLIKLGRNLYSESLSSGQPMLGVPGSGSRGAISPSTLEMSNVDLASEFVKMIITQRAFQANSKVITASDEMLSDVINIIR